MGSRGHVSDRFSGGGASVARSITEDHELKDNAWTAPGDDRLAASPGKTDAKLETTEDGVHRIAEI